MQHDSLAALRGLLIGVWRCNSSGTTTELSLDEDGNYFNTSDAGLTQHWGTWTVEASGAPSGASLIFHLRGAAPQSWQAPWGPVTIDWPAKERWAIINISPDRVLVPGIELERRGELVRKAYFSERGSIPR